MAGVVLLSLTIALGYFLKRRRMSKPVAPYPESTTLEGTALAVGNFADHPKYRLFNPVVNQVQAPLPDHPVEAGLMSRSKPYASFPSDISRRTLASS